MENYSESERWMKDVRSCFARAQRCFDEEDWQGAVQNAQLAIELSVKAIISLFEEPDWTHSPDKQLREIVEARKEEVASIFSPSFDRLRTGLGMKKADIERTFRIGV